VDNDLQTFLEAVPLFSPILWAQLQGLAAIFEPICAEKEAVICRDGEPGDAMYSVTSGAVGVYVARDSTEVFGNYLHRGDFFGEMALLVQRERNAIIWVLFKAHLYRADSNRRSRAQLMSHSSRAHNSCCRWKVSDA
jgi:CRP-like cAMP-binding protein